MRGADTFFIATAVPPAQIGASAAHGVDVSHRGGRPGFVRVQRDADGVDVLTVPDFAGNQMFNTLGNLQLHPRAGLLFVDFARGDRLHVAVDTELLWQGDELAAFAGAQRLLKMRVREVCASAGARGWPGASRFYHRSCKTPEAGRTFAADHNRGAPAQARVRTVFTSRPAGSGRSARMSRLFEPVTAGALHLPNRIVMAPLTRNRSPNAVPTDMAVTYYTQRASAGLLITEATAISHQGQGYADVPGLYAPEQLKSWRRVTDSVHAAGGRIVVQLWHVGRVSHHELQPAGGTPVAPSAIAAKTKTVLIRDGKPVFEPTVTPRALHGDEIPGIVAAYARATHGALEDAGFDGVEIHGANGYLVDQFLKTGANHRTDAYGGSIENRTRFLRDVVHAVVDAAGPGRAAIRLSPVTPANDIVDADPQPLFQRVAQIIGPLPLAYVHVIEGATGGVREIPDRPFDYDAFKRTYLEAGGRGAWMVNNGYDRALAEAAVERGADLIAFGKPYIANPDLVRRLRDGVALNTPDRATFYGGGAQGYIDYPVLEPA